MLIHFFIFGEESGTCQMMIEETKDVQTLTLTFFRKYDTTNTSFCVRKFYRTSENEIKNAISWQYSLKKMGSKELTIFSFLVIFRQSKSFWKPSWHFLVQILMKKTIS